MQDGRQPKTAVVPGGELRDGLLERGQRLQFLQGWLSHRQHVIGCHQPRGTAMRYIYAADAERQSAAGIDNTDNRPRTPEAQQ